MLRKEITPGVVLTRGRGRGKRRYDPVAVLDVSTMWQEHVVRGDATYTPVQGWQFFSDSGRGLTHGYLVVEPDYRVSLTVEERVGAMQRWLADVPQQLTRDAVNRLHRDMPEGLQLAAIHSRFLVCTWEEHLRLSAADEKQRRERLEREQAVREREALVRRAVEETAFARGIDLTGVTYGHQNNVVMPVGVLARLLNIDIPELPPIAT